MPIKQKIKHQSLTNHQINEIKKCANDPVYFAKYIKDIKLYPFQKTILRTFKENYKVFSLNSRQIGGTTVCLIYMLWYAMFNSYKTVSMSSINHNISRIKCTQLKEMFNSLPDFLKPELKKYYVDQITFVNDSCIIFTNYLPDAYRGFEVNLLILDDFAFATKPKDFWACTSPIITYNNTIINTSINPSNEFILSLWNDSFKKIVVPWFLLNGRDNEWYNNMENIMGTQQFKQEYLDFGMKVNNEEFSNKILVYWKWFKLINEINDGKILEF